LEHQTQLFQTDGRLIGEYFNVNTPVEVYPYGARYLDLEVDVVRRTGEEPRVLDEEKLAYQTKQGSVSPSLARKAMQVVDEIMRIIQQPT
jgi:predicted RNA-binding protein associated with RNAse of E/G family